MPDDKEKSIFVEDNMVGRVGRCSKGNLGLITHWKMLPHGLSWVGINLENGRSWASRNPRLIPLGSDHLKVRSDRLGHEDRQHALLASPCDLECQFCHPIGGRKEVVQEKDSLDALVTVLERYVDLLEKKERRLASQAHRRPR